jgi:spermidine synthase
MIAGPTMKDRLAFVALALSGAAGLIFEVCWIRRAGLAFGSTTFALSTVLATFFLGLAVGSQIFGQWSRRASRPLLAYAVIELTLGLLALATLPGFDVAERLYGLAYRATQGSPLVHAGLRFALVAVVILPPAVLMGGTLPLFSRRYVTQRQKIAGSVGALYAVNTLGAAVGCLLAGLVLIPNVGVSASVGIGALLNLIAAGIVFALHRDATEIESRDPAVETRPSPRERRPAPARTSTMVLSILVFVAGGVALGTEVLWTRFLALLVRNTVYTYTLTLAVFLVGIVLGSLAASWAFDRRVPRAVGFGVLQLAFGITVLALLGIPADTWERMGPELWVHAVLLLPPAFLSGSAFPLAVRLATDDPRVAGPVVGRITAINTLGGIAGALGVGFLMLPAIGIERSALVLTGLSVLAGIVSLLWLEPGVRHGRLAIGVAGLLLWLALPHATGTRVPQDYLARGGVLLDYREGLESNLGVLRQDRARVLVIDRWWQGQDRKTHQIMAAHLPMLLHRDARRALVVGVGAGQTPARFLLYSLERLDCVDIEPKVFDLIAPHFGGEWLTDPRVTIWREDGRYLLNHGAGQWDVISLELGQIFRPGVASFYTADFYRRARTRLSPDGMLVQFVPLPFFSPATFRSTLATFLEVFPISYLWYNTSELLLIGVNGDPLQVNAARLDSTLALPGISDDLDFALWGGPAYRLSHLEVLLGGFLCGPRGIEALAAGGQVLRDDRPVLEYATTDASALEANELPLLDDLRRHLDPVGSMLDTSLAAGRAARVTQVRAHNLDDIAAAAWIRKAEAQGRAGEAVGAATTLERALALNPENVHAQRLLADALAVAGRAADARVAYRRALALDPGDPAAHRGLANLMQQAGEIDSALSHYRAAIDADPRDFESHNNLGAVLGSRGDHEGALGEFARALEIQPDYVDARRNYDRLRAFLDAQKSK